MHEHVRLYNYICQLPYFLFLTNKLAKVKFIELSSKNLEEEISIGEPAIREEYNLYLANFDTSVKKNVQKEPSISVDEQIAEDESIFKELSNLDYTESQSHFSELVLKLVQSVNFKNHSKTENIC